MDKTIHYCDNSQHHQINHHQDIGAGAIGNLPSSIPKQGGEDVEGALIVPSVLAPSFQSNTCFGNERVSLPKATSTHHKYNVGCRLIENSTLALQPQGKEGVLKWSDKCALVIDWFEARITGVVVPNLHDVGEVKTVGNTHFELLGATKHYRKLIQIYYHGEQYGKLMIDPINPSVQCSIIRLDNPILYQNGWTTLFTEFLNVHNWEFEGMTRLDIALDGTIAEQYFNLLVKANNKRSTIKQFKFGKGVSIKPHYPELKADPNQWTIGSKSSNRCAKVYNKSMELGDNGNKPYIRDYLNNNGLNEYLLGTDIYRLEITLRAKETERINGFDYRRLEDTQYLTDLMKFELLGDGKTSQPFLKFYKEEVGNRGGKVRKAPPRINPIMRLKSEPTKLSKAPKKASDGIYVAKLAIKALTEQVELNNTSTATKRAYNDSIYALLEQFDLHSWYAKKHPKISEGIAIKNRLKVA